MFSYLSVGTIWFLITIFLLGISYSLYRQNMRLMKKNKEGFNNFDECRSKGFSKEFCVQTPTSVIGPNACICQDGKIGQILPGFGGECICRGERSYWYKNLL